MSGYRTCRRRRPFPVGKTLFEGRPLGAPTLTRVEIWVVRFAQWSKQTSSGCYVFSASWHQVQRGDDRTPTLKKPSSSSSWTGSKSQEQSDKFGVLKCCVVLLFPLPPSDVRFSCPLLHLKIEKRAHRPRLSQPHGFQLVAWARTSLFVQVNAVH